MIDNAGEEIKAVEECFPNSTVLLCHFNVLHSWHRNLNHNHNANKDPYKIAIWEDLWRLMKTENSDIWIIRSITNADIEYSVRKNNSRDDLNLTSYICICHDFRVRQLPCKHIFAVLSQLQVSEDSEEENNQFSQYQQSAETNILDSSSSFYYPINYKDKKKYEFKKLQEELAAITAE
ncbi:4729_t:CDS:2 [Scutellospora calospora]|uniref:4729_t:CDS:1 n=1 Tax=Scutellospora calospora TaxID=85575 RepID=A0ACA9LFK4_9GLOM|nr:4729_t:CDS:2 [Scutellospora calospora]